MSKSRGPFPTKDADFNDYLQPAVPYIDANAGRLNAASNQTALDTMFGQWNTIYPQSQNPNTATSTITAQKTQLRSDMEDLLRVIYSDIPESALTQQDRQTLNLPERDTTPTPVAIADHAPAIGIDSMQHLVITLRITDPDNPHTQAMPDGQGAEVNVAVQDMSATSFTWDADRSFITHRFLSDVQFEAGDVGKKAHFRCRYLNTRGEPGPWSDTMDSMIS